MQALRILLLVAAAMAIVGCGEKPPANSGPQGQITQPTATEGSLAADIHRRVAVTTGYDPSTILVAVPVAQVIVKISNSKLLQSGHAARDREAEAISAAVVQVIESAGPAKSIQAIHIDYIRPTDSSKPEVIDSIDFRKNPDGKFLKDVT